LQLAARDRLNTDRNVLQLFISATMAPSSLTESSAGAAWAMAAVGSPSVNAVDAQSERMNNFDIWYPSSLNT